MTISDANPESLCRCYPVLAALSPAERNELLASLRWMSLPARAAVFDERQACAGFPFVVAGAIRVSKSAPSGREITLYRVEPGDSCVITTGCLLGASAYNARGQTDGETVLGLLPAPAFERLIRLEPFRRFVFGLFAERIAALMQLIEEVAFRKLYQRLAALLLQRGPIVRATHQQLADELGSVREIVSRLLKGFADQGVVELHREQVEVIDIVALRRWAEGMA